jgi:CHU_C Type IX secretion signal domain
LKEKTTTGVQPQSNIPNIARRNHVWNIPLMMTTANEVVIFNMEGSIVFRTGNYRNNIILPNVSTGIYFYQIRYRNEKGEMIRQSGKLLITD